MAIVGLAIAGPAIAGLAVVADQFTDPGDQRAFRIGHSTSFPLARPGQQGGAGSSRGRAIWRHVPGVSRALARLALASLRMFPENGLRSRRQHQHHGPGAPGQLERHENPGSSAL